MSAQISLRPFLERDKEMVREWRNRNEVNKYMYTDHEISAEEHDQWFQNISKDSTCRYFVICCNGIDVGLLYITDINLRHSRCSWAFYVADPSARGKGVGSWVEFNVLKMVFEELKLNKLCCEVLESNIPVIKMHEGFGFRREGSFRGHVIKGQSPTDIACLAMLAEDWKILKPGIEARLKTKGIAT